MQNVTFCKSRYSVHSLAAGFFCTHTHTYRLLNCPLLDLHVFLTVPLSLLQKNNILTKSTCLPLSYSVVCLHYSMVCLPGY